LWYRFTITINGMKAHGRDNARPTARTGFPRCGHRPRPHPGDRPNARTIWFALLGFLAFIGLTLVSVRDIDFFSVAATTDLPIVNIAIPTDTFFWTAAWLAAVLHTYFHLYLVKLWDALAEAPPEIGGTQLGDRVFPWLVVDWALRRRADRPTTRRPMDLLASFVTWLVIWLATPLMLAAFWWRSMPAHDARLTLAIAAALLLSLFATLRGWRRARRRLTNPGIGDTRAFWRSRRRLDGLRRALGSVAVLALWLLMLAGFPGVVLASLAAVGWHNLPAWIDDHAQWFWRNHAKSIWASVPASVRRDLLSIDRDEPPLVVANLVDAEIAQRPADWRDHDVARGQFQIGWCRDHAVPLQDCRKLEHEARFSDLAAEFVSAWATERSAYLANIISPNLRGRDLRGAAACGAFLAGIDLRAARLEGADLCEARLEGAILRDARLEDADLSAARLQGANLVEAWLEGANLSHARLEGASLIEARLQGANLRLAGLEGANLSHARLEGADIRWAVIRSAEWRGATLSALPAHSADFAGGRHLSQSQLAQVIGDDNTILPRDAYNGEQLYVCTCWAEPPPTLDGLLRHWPESSPSRFVADWFCPGGAPQRTGWPAHTAPDGDCGD
jgi:uncharacterized protein YjbI with pentapeptide repeats